MKQLTILNFLLFSLSFQLLADGINPTFNNGKKIIKHQFNHFIDGAVVKPVEVFNTNAFKSYRALQTTRFQQKVLYIQSFNEQLVPDNSFGVNGELYIPVPQNFQFAKVCIGSNQTILVAGSDSTATLRDIYLARFLFDGSVDQSFGNQGVLKMPLTYLDDFVQDIALPADGKIVMLSNDALGGNFKVYRLLSNGASDTSFNGVGNVSIDLGVVDLAQRLCLMPDQKIWIAGKVSGNVMVKIGIAKLLPNGTLDSSFAQKGSSIEFIGTNEDQLLDIKVLPNGNVMALVKTEISSATNAFVQWKTDGSRENNFGINGVLNVQWNSYVGFMNDTAGNVYAYSNFIIKKYSTQGILDSNFTVNYHNLFNSAKLERLLVNNQHLVLLGIKTNNQVNIYHDNTLYYQAFDFAGKLDSTAYDGGSFFRHIGNFKANTSKISLLATASNNKGEMICLVNTLPNPLQLFLVKYLSDGNRDSSFGQNGLIYLNIKDFRESAFSIQCINDNKFLLAFAETNTQAQLQCYHLNGLLDSSFGLNGTTTFSLPNAGFMKLLIDDQDRIVLAGNRFKRFLANGQIDSNINFQVAGGIKAAMILKDGKFLVGGSFGIKKLQSNGEIDAAFGVDGHFTDTIINFKNQKLHFVCTDLSYDYKKLMVLASGTYYAYVTSPRYDMGTFLLSEDAQITKNIFRNSANLNSCALHLALPNHAGLVTPTQRIEDYSYAPSGIVQFKNLNLNDTFNVLGKIDLIQDIFSTGSSTNNVKSSALGAYYNNSVLLLRATDSAFYISEITVTPDSNFPYNQMRIEASKNYIGVNEEIYLMLHNSIFPHQKKWILPDSIGIFTNGTNAQSDTCYVRFNKPGIYDIYLDYIMSDTTVKLQALQFIRVMSVGLEEANRKGIKLYPNPSRGALTLELGEVELISYEVFNTEGKSFGCIKLNKDTKHQLNLPEPTGLYMIQLVDDKGNSYFHKILRQ